MILTAVIALIQIDAARNGKPSVIAVAVTTVVSFVQTGVAGTVDAARSFFGEIAELPKLRADQNRLETENGALRAENERLNEALALAPDAASLARERERYPASIVALIVGFDPENQTRTATIDRGSRAGVTRDAGVVNDDGVVGRIFDVGPFASRVLLATDPTSKIPAVVQRGRWWGIATGTNTRVALQYVSQDAALKIGDLVVTGEGRSFHAGLPIGRIFRIIHPEGALYQTAILEPSVAFGRLSHVLVLTR